MQPKRQLVFLFFVVSSATLAGCQGALPPPVPPPHQGATVRVACPPEVGDLVARQARAWEDRQQARVTVVAPDAEADLWVIAPNRLPGHAAAGELQPLPEALLARTSPFDWAGLLTHYTEPLLVWDRVAYAAPLLGEAPVCLYRTDLYDDPAHKQNYRAFQHSRAKDGKPILDLRPPASWDELAVQAEYFRQAGATGKASLPPLPVDDAALDRLFYTVAAPYVRRGVRQGEAADRDELFAFHYELATGQPRIATPGFVAALALLQRLQACRPDAASARPAEAFLNGKAVLCVTEPGTLARAQQRPALRDKVGVCLIPGADRYFTPAGMPVALKGSVNRVPYFGGAGWLLAVPKSAKQGAAATDLLAELAGPRRGMQMALAPENGGGMTRMDQVLRDRWGAFGLDEPRTGTLKNVARAVAQHGLKSPALVLRTPDEAAARQALAAALRPALARGTDAQQVLDGVQERWEKLAAGRGDRHAAEYRLSLGLLGK